MLAEPMKRYADIVGDGGSEVLAQVVAQRQTIESAFAGIEHRIAIASGKGGVGKSTATMAVAMGLKAAGRRVVVLDCDFSGPCQAQMAGLRGAPWVPAEGALAIPRRRDGLGVVSFGSFLGEAVPTVYESVAEGDDHIWRSTREFATLGQLIAAVDWRDTDVLIYDLPPGADRSAQFASFLGPGTAFVIVTIPSDLARGVVARSISALRRHGAWLVGYIENMAGYHHRGTGEILPLFPEADVALDLPCLGKLPFDPELARWCDQGWPDDPRQPAAAPGSEALIARLQRALEAA